MWLRQMAQLSTTMSGGAQTRKKSKSDRRIQEKNNLQKSRRERTCVDPPVPQAQRETAFHFLMSKRLAFFPAAAEEPAGAGATATPPLSIARAARRGELTLARITPRAREEGRSGEAAALD